MNERRKVILTLQASLNKCNDTVNIGNIIAALNTGSGKTLISLMLIKWISAQAASTGKAIIFLVPKVTLVEQQANFIAQNTPLRVIKLHGALDIDLTDRLGWERRFAMHDVFVMTGAFSIFLFRSTA